VCMFLSAFVVLALCREWGLGGGESARRAEGEGSTHAAHAGAEEARRAAQQTKKLEDAVRHLGRRLPHLFARRACGVLA
jgi:hypothetical protein